MLHAEEGLMERTQEADEGVAERSGSVGDLSSSDPRQRKRVDGVCESRDLYFGLLQEEKNELTVARSRDYLVRQLECVAERHSDLPDDIGALHAWSDSNTVNVGVKYREYLQSRRAGLARRYFPGKSHALHFLKSVAPTKLVDGAWLYGLLPRWREPRFLPLIQTYVEELGEGLPDKNHVAIYKRLLAAHGCQQWTSLDDPYFVQGAIQLSLAEHAASFWPEVIGYNLGYEQLPLHLLITAYELNELGIDPYYFTLHVTVDNAASGHATQAVEGVLEALPQVADKVDFYRRVVNGYKLNDLGASTNSTIAEFDLEDELLAILSAKAEVGAMLHSDYCKIAGKSVNEWLSKPDQLPAFLDSLQSTGWIQRDQNPENSRFWKLIEGGQAQMFGVFNAYEKQVIHDWIAGDSLNSLGARPLSFRAKQRLMATTLAGSAQDSVTPERASKAVRGAVPSTPYDEFDSDLLVLEQELANAADEDEAMQLIIKLMSPVHHHTGAGLMATRIFARWLKIA